MASMNTPAEFICPISNAVMENPVVDREGNSYEEAAINQWFGQGNTTSPITRNPLLHSDLTVNRALKGAIEQFHMGEVTAYVSRLKARRNEEAASRKVRSQRRADTVNANTEAFKQRSAAQRRRLMNEKLQMTSQIEHHLFTMLDEQSKWRHVMYQNVVDQEEHLDEMVQTQEGLDGNYMQGLINEEKEVYAEVVKDDCHRWTVLETEQKHEYDTEVRDICTGVLASVQTLAEKVIDFHTTHDLGNDPLPAEDAVPKSTFDAVPAVLLRDWTDQEFYPESAQEEADPSASAAQNDAIQEKTLNDHVSLRLFKVEPGEVEVNNGLFSGLCYKLQKLHQPDPDLFHPAKVRSKAIIVLSGPNFSGKSTTASQVAEQLGLWHLSDVDMIQRAMNEMEREIQDSDLQSPEEVNHAELLDLGVDIRCALQEGESVSDETMAALVLNHIDAMELSPDYRGVIFDGALGSSQKVFELVEAKLCNYNVERKLDVPDKLLAAKLSTMPQVDDPMFIVERPPTPPPEAVNVKESKKAESKPTKRDKKKEEQEEPLPPIELAVIDPVPPLTEDEDFTLKQVEKTVDTFGTHCTVHMHVDPEEVFRRFAGVRADQESGNKYHMDHNPPPLNVMSLVAPIERADTDAVNLHVSAHNDGSDLLRWVERYSHVSTVNAQAPLADVVSAVRSIAESTMQDVEKEAELQTAAEDLLKNRAELEAMFQERIASREGVRKQLAAIYTERGVDPLPLELQETPAKSSESRILPVPAQFPAVFIRMLDDFTGYYKTSLCGIHAEVAKLVESVFIEGRCCMSQFDAFWTQPDTKQPLLSQFSQEFNLMQPALRRDVQGKDELHLRVDDLADQLATIAEKRRDEASTVIDGLLAHGVFVDHWCDAVRLMGGALIQLELERFFIVKQLAMMYYNSIKSEAVTIDESEMTTEVLPMPRGSAADSSAAPAETKDKKGDKKPAPKKGAAKEKERRESVQEDRSPDKLEDHFTVVVDRAIAAMRQAADRLNGPSTPIPVAKGEKGKKANVVEVPQTPDLPPTGALAGPIIQAELELAKTRMETIGRYVMDIIEEGHTRCVLTMKAKMHSKLRKHFLTEMSAVNGVVFLIRTAIEEERPIDHQICLDGATYSVDLGHPLVPARNPKQVQSLARQMVDGRSGSFTGQDLAATGPLLSVNIEETDSFGEECLMLTSALSVSRAEELVRLFKTIAPEFLIYEPDFLTIVRQADYDIVKPCASPAQIFKRFDLLGCGAIDWREFMVHILFYLEPQVSTEADALAETPGAFGTSMGARNQYYVETPSLFQLFDFRNDIGMEPLTKEEYEDIPFFFEGQMEGDRLESYRAVIWNMFAIPMQAFSGGPEGDVEGDTPDQTPEGTISVPPPGSTGTAPEGEMEEMVDPNSLVMFFCADEQPLRGIQKAFAMGASVADENTVLTAEQVMEVFHFNACSASNLGMEDPYDYESILSIFQQPNGSVAETLSFPEACSTQNGRMLLNNTYMYRQREFTAPEEEEVEEEVEGGESVPTTPIPATPTQ